MTNYAELAEQWSGRGTVILIDAQRDGIDQIRTALAGIRGIESIHIVSHGEGGAFQIGTTRVDADAIRGSLASSFAAIGRTLSVDGDILIYGCDFGAGERGDAALHALAQATGADVAASVDATGAAARAGDWDLEARVGLVQTTVLDGGAWNGLLAKSNTGAWTIVGNTSTTVIDGVTVTITFSGAGSSTFSGTANDTFNNIAAFDNSAQGKPSLATTWNSTNTTDVGTITITFSEAVVNPIINLDRLGGTGTTGTSNSALLTLLTSGLTLTKVAGPAHLVVDSTAGTITRSVGQVTTGAESSLVGATGTAAGSVRVNGTVTTLSFSIRTNPGTVAGIGDGFEIGAAIDRSPDAVNDSFSRNEDVGSFTGNVLSNNGNGADSDARADTLTVSAAQNSSGGTIVIGTATTLPSGAILTLNANGTFTYANNGIDNHLGAGETRVETFTYTIRDANGGTDTATATITINGVNDVPVAVNDTASTSEDTPVTVTVLTNDTDVDGDSLSVTTATAANGTVVINANGTLTYTPNANYNGSDTITYTISDGHGGTATATVAVAISAVDDPPVNSIPGNQAVAEDGTLVFSTANGNAISISDAEGGVQTITLNVTNGTLSLSGIAGLTFTQGDGTADNLMTFSGSVAAINQALQGLTYVPKADYNGPAQITMRTITNPTAASGFTNGGFELPNYPDTNTLHFTNESLVPGWDTDATDGIIEVWDSGFQNVPAYEGDQFVEINANQVAALYQNFQPGQGSNVSVQFAHRGRDGVDVMRVVATDLGADGVIGTADDVVLLNENFSDGNTAWGVYTRQLTGAATGNIIRFEFRSVSSAGGSPSVGNFVDGIAVLQGLADFDTININVTPVADIVNDSATTNEDTAVTLNVLANDSFENAARAITAINGSAITAGGAAVAVSNGTVSLNASGQLTFSPTANYNGTTSFTYTVTSNGTTETATATVTVVGVNDAPVATGTLSSRTNVDASTVSVATAGGFSDIDNTTLAYSATGLPAGLTIDAATGVISGTIDRSASQASGGVYTIVVTARDAGNLSATQ
ncbi:Ig-like domain-containing protein, partial [Sphingomonas sp.]|uniref:Ig-like domain-containing protein n=1 Tax=Sphingomonas sp. TaxID=28214 RepID=UPI003D6D7D50